MNIYDETTRQQLDAAAVETAVTAGRGLVYPGRIQTGEMPAVPERWEPMPGAGGLRRRIPAVPPQPVYEDCLFYRVAAEPQSTALERLEAQVLFTALMTDTLLEVDDERERV